MTQIINGVPADSLCNVTWVKSSGSTADGNCVEVALLAGGEVAVRNSRDPHGPALVYTQAEIAAFIAGVKDGEFDLIAS
ncbi:DUF397 domain-containing protein [Streptomyces cyaneochromogenes]|uniref:DUF397 domain-containing protein n=1 Tax=Streptomyces cyaneochromogenes TaxID=2496836 RepID=A0A3Q9F181_9ACTN|nr:DUF397 domain-containing protein [Streptomyces cyaneochromogenes]AZQ32120.1 DUF397 domain-containing protein [Streptomyces cyaneochromogenes]AZQ40103.1 DUF397 domain-containing protein [Streptomyces cyaneochromogenes]